MYRSDNSSETWSVYPDRQVILHPLRNLHGAGNQLQRNPQLCFPRPNQAANRRGDSCPHRRQHSLEQCTRIAVRLLADRFRHQSDHLQRQWRRRCRLGPAQWFLRHRHAGYGCMARHPVRLETRPLSDFTNITTVEARCRNTTVGGNGAVLCFTPTAKAANTHRCSSTCNGNPTARKLSRSMANRPTRTPQNCSSVSNCRATSYDSNSRFFRKTTSST